MQTLYLYRQRETDRNIALIWAELTADRLEDYEAKGQGRRFWEQCRAMDYRGRFTAEVSSPTIKAALQTKGAIWTGSMNISTQLV